MSITGNSALARDSHSQQIAINSDKATKADSTEAVDAQPLPKTANGRCEAVLIMGLFHDS
jgi:hypothetical protein